MGNNFADEVIDLTLTQPDPFSQPTVIIDLISDDSFDQSWKTKSVTRKRRKVSNLTTTLPKKATGETSDKENEKIPKAIGNCPICWDELGQKPLCSTKCGHVFCLDCLERSLKIEKLCPTCRHPLKGKLAYHPLYLS